MNLKYYHNPNCSKSREALVLLQNSGVDVEMCLYLEQGLSQDEVLNLAKKLGMPVSSLVRESQETHETWPHLSVDDDEAWAEVLVGHRHLLQRPILVADVGAVVCRPPQLVLNWLAEQGHEQA